MVKAGDYIQDGSVKWIVTDIRNTMPVGIPFPSPKVLTGTVMYDGSRKNRADYPRLVRFADENELWTDSPSSYPGLFGRGDGSTTFFLPNYVNRMAQFVSSGGAAA